MFNVREITQNEVNLGRSPTINVTLVQDNLSCSLFNVQDNLSPYCDFYDTSAAEDSVASARIQEKVFKHFE